MEKYIIVNEYAEKMRTPQASYSYDMACRIAYYLRRSCDVDFWVVSCETNRAVSEVVDEDPSKDEFARQSARLTWGTR